MMPDSIAGFWARCSAVLPPRAGLTRSGAATNQTGEKSYGRPGRYRREGRSVWLPARDSAAIAATHAAGMITKIRTVLTTDTFAPRRLLSR